MRIGLLPEPEEEGETVDTELQANADAIHKASKPLEFIRLEGEPILSLPEVEEEPTQRPAKKAPRKKKKDNKASLSTPAPPRVQTAMTIQPSKP